MTERTGSPVPESGPELLLPAGELSSVTAAVRCGADAVYLGGQSFSARQNARNFSPEELEQAVRFCHARGVKVYQTLNTLIFDRQFPALEQAVRLGCALGIDAFIVQDWGLISLLRERCPGMRLHASTQMTVHTLRGARLLKELGAERVVLARELSLEEIREIAGNAGIETEVFVHGALCMSVSGQCYLSGMIGGRSGNRGSCAGACRLPWRAGAGRPDPAGDYALSLKDLCLAEQIPALREAGVASLKVEGRMKRPEYVAAAARAYRAALDGEPPELEPLRAVFSRSGFTGGYLSGRRDREMFGFRQKEDVTAATPKVLKALEHAYQAERGRVPLSLRLEARAGQPLRLTGSDGARAVQAEGLPPEPAESRPSTREGVEASLGKLGGTIFLPGECRAELDEGLFLPAAAVNGLRRRVCEELLRLREETAPIPFLEAEGAPEAAVPSPGAPGLRARFLRAEQIPLELLPELELFSLPLEEAEHPSLAPWREKLVLEPDRVLFGREEEAARQLNQLREQGFRRLLCENPAHLALAREAGLLAHGGAFLNCANSRAAALLGRLGAVDQLLTFELNLKDARQIVPAVPLGLISYGHLPLMLTRVCPAGPCRGCDGERFLTDRTGARFRVLCRRKRYSELLNGEPLWMGDRLGELEAFAFHLLYFTKETQAECREVLTRFRRGQEAPARFTRGLYYRSV
jgi:putative protease